jgi:hypothetical protein
MQGHGDEEEEEAEAQSTALASPKEAVQGGQPTEARDLGLDHAPLVHHGLREHDLGTAAYIVHDTSHKTHMTHHTSRHSHRT